MIENNYSRCHYGIDGAAKMATDFYPLEKAAKVAYRAIDLTHLFMENPRAPFILLSSQIKDLILFIEATRFFPVSSPLFFPDKQGVTFFQKKSTLQCVERISLICHLTLKTLFGVDRTGLMHLGFIATHTIGNMPIFRWMVEGTVWMFHFCGAMDGLRDIFAAKTQLEQIQTKTDLSINRKWTFEQAKANLKIVFKVSKVALITFAVTAAVTNFSGLLCQSIILSLGIISDALGLIAFYHSEYYNP
jgi:hypothetical protein